MKTAFFVLFALSLAFAGCNNKSGPSASNSNTVAEENSNASEPEERQKTPEELKAELKQQEQENPTEYLSASGTYKENFWGDKYKINCTITNKATIATFKDVVVKVKYLSKTHSVIATEKYVVYEVFKPNSTKTVKLTINNYRDVMALDWDVVSAKPVTKRQ